MNTVREILQNCTVEGTVVKLPKEQFEKKLYQEVAKALGLIGGKWVGGKTFGFVFPTDPTELLGQIAGGEKINLQKEYQFFATPDSLADILVEIAYSRRPIDGFNTLASAYGLHKILEPSAGQGAIIDAIKRKLGICVVYTFELMDVNREVLLKKYGERSEYFLLSKIKDFLEYKPSMKFHWIIANPPFTKNQDILHIKKMYECLAEGGVLVSVASRSWVDGSQKIQMEFKEWLQEVNAGIMDVEEGTFKESGTMVGGKVIIISK